MRYYKVLVKYQIGNVEAEWDGFYTLKEDNFVSDLQAHDSAYLALVKVFGENLLDFDFEVSNELEFKRWDKKRIEEKEYGISLKRAIQQSKELNHSSLKGQL